MKIYILDKIKNVIEKFSTFSVKYVTYFDLLSTQNQTIHYLIRDKKEDSDQGLFFNGTSEPHRFIVALRSKGEDINQFISKINRVFLIKPFNDELQWQMVTYNNQNKPWDIQYKIALIEDKVYWIIDNEKTLIATKEVFDKQYFGFVMHFSLRKNSKTTDFSMLSKDEVHEFKETIKPGLAKYYTL